MNFAYVLSAEDPYYVNQLVISASSLLRHHPDANVFLLIDKQTSRYLHRTKSEVLGLNISVVETNAPDYGFRDKSRFLKTQMRSLIFGDFVFLDCDTLIMRPLDQLESIDGPIGAVLDMNVSAKGTYFPEGIKDLYEQANWPWPTQVYINAGVMFFKDLAITTEFFSRWYENWDYSRIKGCGKDQPAINRTIDELGLEVTLLNNSYNALVRVFPSLFRNCHVAHFFAANIHGESSSVLDYMIKKHTETGVIDWKIYESAKKESNPWGPNAEAYQFMQSGHYLKAVKQKISQIISG